MADDMATTQVRATDKDYWLWAKRAIAKGYSEDDPAPLLEVIAGLADGAGPWHRYYLALAQFRLGCQRAIARSERARALQTAGDLLAAIPLEAAEDRAEVNALQGCAAGQLVRLQPLRRARAGLAADQVLQQALSLAPDNPRAVFANAAAAAALAGVRAKDTERAIQALQRACTLFEQQQPPPDGCMAAHRPDWGHDEAWLWLGSVYRRRGDLKQARRSFIQALDVNPALASARRFLLELSL